MPTKWQGHQEVEPLLARELGDETVACAFAQIVVADALQWRPPVMAPSAMTTILGYTFAIASTSTVTALQGLRTRRLPTSPLA